MIRSQKQIRYAISTILLCASLSACQSVTESYKLSFHEDNEVISTENGIRIPPGLYAITKVSDGDTFWCMDDKGDKLKIRLIGIDAPEPRNYFNKKEQPFGREASAYAKELLSDQVIKLSFDVDSIDPFGRTLAYAYFTDGTFINEKIVKDGYAVLMTIAPNVQYEDVFVKAQQHAKENKLGLWAKPVTE
ncbi:thermonuclease family protein [Sphingobacterium sp. MYb382]|uniref:thermonuclease family protein n=1 Tax=Sphingobacterium sp. MYb382 TaxID=2745278 RepID=UPI0030B65291